MKEDADGNPDVRHVDTLTAHNKTVNVVRFSPGGDMLASGVRLPPPSHTNSSLKKRLSLPHHSLTPTRSFEIDAPPTFFDLLAALPDTRQNPKRVPSLPSFRFLPSFPSSLASSLP